MGNNGMDRRGWHVDKSISPSVILSVLTMLGSVFYLYADFNKNMALLQQSAAENKEKLDRLSSSQIRIDERQDSEIKEVRRDTAQAYQRIDGKIDLLLSSKRH